MALWQLMHLWQLISDPRHTEVSRDAQISQKQDERNIYVIMKTMCPPDLRYIYTTYQGTFLKQVLMKTFIPNKENPNVKDNLC